MKSPFQLLAVLMLMVAGCQSAGTLTLALTSTDPAHTGVPVFLELRDNLDRRVAITSAKVTSAPIQLHLPRVLDGRRYQALWWLDLDGDGAPSTSSGQTEPVFQQNVAGTSDLALWYPHESWEESTIARAETIPPFCEANLCDPDHQNNCPDRICIYYAAASQWLCCARSPFETDSKAH